MVSYFYQQCWGWARRLSTWASYVRLLYDCMRLIDNMYLFAF
jgi:hypothetical protein